MSNVVQLRRAPIAWKREEPGFYTSRLRGGLATIDRTERGMWVALLHREGTGATVLLGVAFTLRDVRAKVEAHRG